MGIVVILAVGLATGSEPARQWERWEAAFTAGEAADGQSTRLEVQLTSPTGKRHITAGFWDGDLRTGGL
jgi:hypothetical protein